MVVAGPLTGPRAATVLVAAVGVAVALTVVVMLALTGSGPFRSEPPAPPGPGPSASGLRGPGVYTLKTRHGASITFEIPAPSAPDEDVEELRGDLHVEPVTYVEMEIDNTEGSRPVEIRELTVRGPNEGLYPFYPATEALVDWGPARTGDGGYVLVDGTEVDADRGAALAGRARAAMERYADPVPVGQQGGRLMIGDFERLPDVFAEFQVSPYAGEPPQSVPSEPGAGPEQDRPSTPAPSPTPPARPEDAVAEPPPAPAPTPPPTPRPTEEPVPVFTPNCADPGQPTDPMQQEAWNAACAPVPPPVVDPPPTQPQPLPTQQPQQPAPTAEPTVEPAPSPAPEPPAAPADPQPGRENEPPTGGDTAGGGNEGIEAVPTAAPSPDASVPLEGSAPATPASSLPSTGDPA